MFDAKLKRTIAAHGQSGDRAAFAHFNCAIAALHIRDQLPQDVGFILVGWYCSTISVPAVVSFWCDNNQPITAGVAGQTRSSGPVGVMSCESMQKVEHRITSGLRVRQPVIWRQDNLVW